MLHLILNSPFQSQALAQALVLMLVAMLPAPTKAMRGEFIGIP